MTWQLVYYNAKVAGIVEPWPAGVRARYLRILELMTEHGPDLGVPHTKAMGGGLFEIRARGHEGIGRAFYCTITGKQIVILHAFVKKTQKTPPRELSIARTRQREVMT